MRLLLNGFVFSNLALAQSFDAASIKLSPPPDGHGMRVSSSGGPGTKDPGLYTCENCTLASLVTTAYNIKTYQLACLDIYSGARLMISIRIQAGVTKEQFQIMMQDLLKERFHLSVHHDRKEMPMYDLVIAKNGAKLTPSVPAADAQASPSGSDLVLDKDGYPILRGTKMSMASTGDRARANWPGFTTQQLAANLSGQLGKPVTDATGLQGTYDITLSWDPSGGLRAAATEADSQPDLFAAVQEQLGLRLEQKKGMVEILVVDHAEKLPTEN